MDVSAQLAPNGAAGISAARKFIMLAPLAAALAYPFLLKGFHLSFGQPGDPPSAAGMGFAALCILGAVATPIFALAWAHRLSLAEFPSSFDLRARRLSYLAMAVPPLFVFTGVARGLLGGPLTDETVWIGFWLIAAACAFLGSGGARPVAARPIAGWRVAHGISAALIACFVLFHLANHLLGWLGPEAHAAAMEIGRAVYRSPMVELLLVASLLFQVASGIRLAWAWSARQSDWYRVFQIGSGVYLAAFVLTHLNSALVSARWLHGTETDWAWASGAPDGLIYDSWNIRLLPHYAFGVFFVLSHIASGLRQILTAHGVDDATANRAWIAGLIASALGSAAITAALIGARI